MFQWSSWNVRAIITANVSEKTYTGRLHDTTPLVAIEKCSGSFSQGIKRKPEAVFMCLAQKCHTNTENSMYPFSVHPFAVRLERDRDQEDVKELFPNFAFNCTGDSTVRRFCGEVLGIAAHKRFGMFEALTTSANDRFHATPLFPNAAEFSI
jgi:hypothetical protein